MKRDRERESWDWNWGEIFYLLCHTAAPEKQANHGSKKGKQMRVIEKNGRQAHESGLFLWSSCWFIQQPVDV